MHGRVCLPDLARILVTCGAAPIIKLIVQRTDCKIVTKNGSLFELVRTGKYRSLGRFFEKLSEDPILEAILDLT